MRRNPCSQEEVHSKTNIGSIHPLRATNLFRRGGGRPLIQYSGINWLSYGPTACGLQERKSSAHKIPATAYLRCPHPGRRRTRRHRQPTSYRQPFLDHILLPSVARRVLSMRHQHSVNTFLTTVHPVLHWQSANPSHHRNPTRMCRGHLCQSPLHY